MAEQTKISYGSEISRDMQEKDYRLQDVRPPSAPGLAFRILLPKSWKPLAGLQVATPLRGLTADFVFGIARDLQVQAYTTGLPFEVNLRDWLEYLAFEKNFKIAALESRNTPLGQVIHAMATTPDQEYLRIYVQGDGPSLLLLLGRAGRNKPIEHREILGLAAASCQFLNRTIRATREPLSTYHDPHDKFTMAYPASWSHSPDSSLAPSKTAVDFRVATEKETLAYMSVEADSRYPRTAEGHKQIFDLTCEQLEESGIKINTLEPVPASEMAGEKERWVGECQLPKSKGQLAMLIRPGKNSWLTATLVTPDKGVNPGMWMRGKRFFELTVATLGEIKNE